MPFHTLQCLQGWTQQVGITALILLRLVDEQLRRYCCCVGKESWSLHCPSISSQQDLDMVLRGGEGFWCYDKVWSLDIICVILKQNGKLCSSSNSNELCEEFCHKMLTPLSL